jgi:nucleoside-diphosphate-sugar epimerase
VSRFFVTGATGFIGRHLVEHLIEAGHDVMGLARGQSPPASGDRSVQWIRGDVLEPDSYRESLRRVDVVVHLAGILHARRAEAFARVNVTGTQRLLDACIEVRAPRRRFVLVSSIAAMGAHTSDALLRETDPCRPQSEYGKSKLQAEVLARACAARLPIAVVRPSFIYGRGDGRGFGYLDAIWKGVPSLTFTSVKTFSPCHVADLVAGCRQAALADVPSGEVFILSGDEVLTWESSRAVLLDLLREALPTAPAVAAGPTEPFATSARAAPAHLAGLPQYWACDITKARTVLGFAPRIALRDGARDTLLWYREQGAFAQPIRSGECS